MASSPAKGGAGAAAGGAAPAKKETALDTTEACIKWRDRIKRERVALAGATHVAEFAVNPRKLKGLTPKIGEPEPELDPSLTRPLHDSIVAATRPPQERSSRPVTSSQEYGWSWSEGEKDIFREPSKTCAEVQFATRFYETFHTGLYSRSTTAAPAPKSPAGKAK